MGEPTEVSWGLSHLANKALAEGSQAAWGARTIWSPGKTPDVLGDRQGMATPEHVDDAGAQARRRGFGDLLSARLERAWEKVEELSYEMDENGKDPLLCGRTHRDFVLFEDRLIKIVGNPNSSCGYLYVAAWLKPVSAEYKWSNRDGLPVPDFGDTVHCKMYHQGAPMGNVTVLTHYVTEDYMAVICDFRGEEILAFGCDIKGAA